jgi:hypothetical protein
VCWDRSAEQLVLGDARGNLEVWNVYRERKVGSGSVLPNSNGHVSKGVGVLAGRDAGAHAPERPIIENMSWSGDGKFTACLPNDAVIKEWTIKRDLECEQVRVGCQGERARGAVCERALGAVCERARGAVCEGFYGRGVFPRQPPSETARFRRRRTLLGCAR